MSSFSPSTWACTRRSASFVTASPVRRQQHTHVVPPCLRPFLVRPTILGARPGSCRKPPGPLHVKSGKEFDLLAFAYVVRCGLTPFSRSGGAPRTAVHVVGPGGCPIGQRDPAAAREVLSLRRQGPNAVQRAAVLPDVVAPRERWAKLAKRTLDGRRRLNRPASTPGNAAGTPPSPLMTEVHSIRHVRSARHRHLASALKGANDQVT